MFRKRIRIFFRLKKEECIRFSKKGIIHETIKKILQVDTKVFVSA